MKILAYIVYYVIMFTVGFILPTANAGVNTWQYWVLLAFYIVVFMCGFAAGRC